MNPKRQECDLAEEL